MGASVQPVAVGDEPTATPDDSASVDDPDSDQSDDSPLALSISPKRALVSLAFLGAIAARSRREPAG